MEFDGLFKKAECTANELFNRYHIKVEGFDTVVAHVGHTALSLSDIGNPVMPPICLSTTFQQSEPGTGKYDYSRSGNYSREALEKCLAATEGGACGIAFGSGLAAVTALMQLLSAGDHVVAFDDLYGGTGRLFRNIGVNHGLAFDFIDMRNLKLVKESLTPSTKIVFLETPSNPLMRLVDISEIAKISHEYNSEIIVVVDNTFMTPYFQRPIQLGADVVLQSLTKYINGHSDVVMGSLVVRDDRPDIIKKLQFIQFAVGAVPSPFDCYLCLRGMRTLALRMRTHMLSGLIIAAFLEDHPLVESVIHPGLPSHPQHDIAIKQMNGFSGMISFYIKGSAEQTRQFVKKVKKEAKDSNFPIFQIFCLAESLGGYESLIEIPSLMTHISVPPDIRKQLGITDNMIRLSVGIEDCRDLARDLWNAFLDL